MKKFTINQKKKKRNRSDAGMAGFKNKLGPIEVYLTRDQVNAMLTMLDTMIVGGYECSFGDMSRTVRDKIIKYGKPITRGDMEEVLIYFYDNEAEILIALSSLYLALIARDTRDYYPEIGQRYRQGLGSSQAAEQKAVTQ